MIGGDFSDWNKKVVECISQLSMNNRPFRNGPMIDAMIPFRLGWTPMRVAQAMTGHCHRDAITLRKLEMGDKYVDLNNEDK